MGGQGSQKLLLRRGLHSSPERQRASGSAQPQHLPQGTLLRLSLVLGAVGQAVDAILPTLRTHSPPSCGGTVVPPGAAILAPSLIATNICPQILLQSRLELAAYFGRPFGSARARDDIGQAVVSFVTGVLKDGPGNLRRINSPDQGLVETGGPSTVKRY